MYIPVYLTSQRGQIPVVSHPSKNNSRGDDYTGGVHNDDSEVPGGLG